MHGQKNMNDLFQSSSGLWDGKLSVLGLAITF
jgi:hypothetical protein